MTNNIQRVSFKCLTGAFVLLFAAGSSMAAGPRDRTGKWQISLTPTYTDSKTINFQGGATADINGTGGFDIGVGYNFNPHVELEMDIGSNSAGYTGTIVDSAGQTESYAASYYTSYINFGVSYNFMKGPVTPFVKGNLGWTYIDSGVPTGTAGTACWWYPYWGEVCTPYAQTFTSTEWTYGADLGVRYDVTDKMYLKGSIGLNYVDFDKADTEDFTNYRFTVGFMFQ
jgi:hypothetical protein